MSINYNTLTDAIRELRNNHFDRHVECDNALWYINSVKRNDSSFLSCDSCEVINTDDAIMLAEHLMYDTYGRLYVKNNRSVTLSQFIAEARNVSMSMTDQLLSAVYDVISDQYAANEADHQHKPNGCFRAYTSAYDDSEQFDPQYVVSYKYWDGNIEATLQPTRPSDQKKYITILAGDTLFVTDEPYEVFSTDTSDEPSNFESYDLIDGNAYWFNSAYSQHIAEAFMKLAAYNR